MKYFEFEHDNGKDKIAINKGECESNSFYMGKYKYTLGPVKIINNGEKTSIQLISSTCNKTVQILQKNETAITQINANKDLSLIDRTLYVPYPIFVGDGVNSRIETNGGTYDILSYRKYNIKLNGVIIDFIQIAASSTLFVTKNGNAFLYYVCK